MLLQRRELQGDQRLNEKLEHVDMIDDFAVLGMLLFQPFDIFFVFSACSQTASVQDIFKRKEKTTF